ncbi:MAG: hypothetical protein H0V80_08820 [Acidobacteria bacterium]|nr:hypothetical protein [Acidobacteriota bacterium]
MAHPLVEYFRCSEHLALPRTADPLQPEQGYFRFGDVICYGRQAVGAAAPGTDHGIVDVTLPAPGAGPVLLPFDLSEVIGNLRHERYPEAQHAVRRVSAFSVTHAVYYAVRPALPVGVRKYLQRLHWKGWRQIPFPSWPVDVTVEALMRRVAGLVVERSGEFPFIWFWPDGAPGCVMMTHDVESAAGVKFSGRLMDLDDRFGIRSAFQVVPDAPWWAKGATRRFVEQLRRRGFEVNVHDLSHNGRLFRRRERFVRHAAAINARGREFGSRGFRSGAMYRRQDWLAALDISYDMSVPNVAHLEPQQGGCCTVMPYFTGHVLELPLTAAQDYTVFHVLGDYSTRLWQEQIDLILAEHGLISFIAHPDYLIDPRAWEVYTELLHLLDGLRAERHVWIAPPGEIDRWWRNRSEMRLVRDGASWRITGPGSARARVAWARLEGDRVVYEVDRSRRAA